MKSAQLSPNSLNLFLECERCFWLDKKWGIKRPESYPYSLNLAMDSFLKTEFDEYRKKDGLHSLFLKNKIKARLFNNQTLLNKWRSNLKGLRYFDEKTGFELFGAVDDILDFGNKTLAAMDYKTIDQDVPKIYDKFQLQMDVYTLLLEKNGFKTPRKGYLAFYIVNKDKKRGEELPLKKELYEIETNPDGMLKIFRDAARLLNKSIAPKINKDCQFCSWAKKSAAF